MQQDINHPIQLFKQVLASTAKFTPEHADQLQTLLYSYPQSGLLHAIQARLGNAALVQQAAAWFGDSALLQKVAQTPHMLAAVSPAQVIIKKFKAPAQQSQEQVQSTITEEPEFETYYEVIEEDDLQSDNTANANPEILTGDKDQNRPIYKEEPFDDTQKLIIENLAANDYFVFDKAFADRNKTNPEEEYIAPAAPPVAPKQPEPAPQPPKQTAKPNHEEGGVTRYHDDKMPYSFMWWLDKTRNKHSRVYQPFANPAPQNPPPYQQHDEPVNEVFDDRKREEEIVERFIQEEPQIRTPSGDKLDSENKARQSVTDQEELITETLARIYADQTLYSKAIAAYKILMLKNPEKRRYFASQIEILQKKIN